VRLPEVRICYHQSGLVPHREVYGAYQYTLHLIGPWDTTSALRSRCPKQPREPITSSSPLPWPRRLLRCEIH